MSNGLFARLKSGLARSSRNLTEGIAGVLTKRKLDDAALDALEETLIAADLGTRLAAQVVERLRHERFGKEATDADVRTVLADEITRTLTPAEAPLAVDDEGAPRPFVMLVVGVNGGGKTTTIGKLAKRLKGEGKSVILAAGDTFRAAATEQLTIWGERTGSRVIAGPVGTRMLAALGADVVRVHRPDRPELPVLVSAEKSATANAGPLPHSTKSTGVSSPAKRTAPSPALTTRNRRPAARPSTTARFGARAS